MQEEKGSIEALKKTIQDLKRRLEKAENRQFQLGQIRSRKILDDNFEEIDDNQIGHALKPIQEEEVDLDQTADELEPTQEEDVHQAYDNLTLSQENIVHETKAKLEKYEKRKRETKIAKPKNKVSKRLKSVIVIQSDKH